MHDIFSRCLRFAVLGVAAFCGACAPLPLGRVISDVRVGNGYIAVDRCELDQVAFHGIRVQNCKTQNYYLGKAAMPNTPPVVGSSRTGG